jgi:hypothetical protein
MSISVKLTFATIIATTALTIHQSPTLAAKPRTATLGNIVTTSGKFATSAKLRSDRKAIYLFLSNLLSASSVSYELTYFSNDIPQGVIGSIRPKKNNETRELLFGTCSKSVCRYHTNIADMKLKVTSKLSSGKTSIKTYIIRP